MLFVLNHLRGNYVLRSYSIFNSTLICKHTHTYTLAVSVCETVSFTAESGPMVIANFLYLMPFRYLVMEYGF